MLKVTSTNVRLPEEDRLFRIQSQRQIIEGDVADVFAERLRVLDGGHGMVVGDEIEAFALILQVNVLLDGTEIIAQVQFAGWLRAAEKSLGRGWWFRHDLDPLSPVPCILVTLSRKATRLVHCVGLEFGEPWGNKERRIIPQVIIPLTLHRSFNLRTR